MQNKHRQQCLKKLITVKQANIGERLKYLSESITFPGSILLSGYVQSDFKNEHVLFRKLKPKSFFKEAHCCTLVLPIGSKPLSNKLFLTRFLLGNRCPWELEGRILSFILFGLCLFNVHYPFVEEHWKIKNNQTLQILLLFQQIRKNYSSHQRITAIKECIL